MVDTLKILISKLTTGERKFFNIFSRIISSTDYLALYKNILNYGNINAEKLKKEIQDKAFIKYLSIRKEFLLDKILYSLVNHHFESITKWSIQKDILFAKVLIDKDLLDKANNFLVNAKKSAYKLEEYELLFQIITIEISLCFNQGFILDYERLKELKEEQNNIYELINNINNLLTIKAELQQFQIIEDIDQADINNFTKLYGHTPYTLENKFKSQRVESIILYNNCVYSFILHDYEAAYDYSKKRYDLYKKNPELFERIEVLQLLANFLYCCCLTKREDLFNDLIDEFRNTKNQTKEEAWYIKRTSCIRQLELYHFLQKYDEANTFALDSERILNSNIYKPSFINTIYFQFLIIRAFIEYNNYYSAISLSQKRYKVVGPDISSSLMKLLELIAHYKLGHYNNLIYSIDSWVKTIRNKRNQFPIEKILIKFFRAISTKITVEEKKKLIQSAINQLNEIENKEFKYSITHYFDFIAWFEKELEEMK